MTSSILHRSLIKMQIEVTYFPLISLEIANSSQQSHPELNNGMLNQSSFLRIIDKLNDEDKSGHKVNKNSKREIEVDIKKLNLNFTKENTKLKVVEVSDWNQSISISKIKKELIRNIKSRWIYFLLYLIH